MNLSYLQIRYGLMVRKVTLTTGEDLEVHIEGSQCKPNCRFIKVTRKGFNILNLDTNRCILKKAVYAKGAANKEFPSTGDITGDFWIPAWVTIQKKYKERRKLA
jgi:hypothetical protein